jgi:hypothetical protein
LRPFSIASSIDRQDKKVLEKFVPLDKSSIKLVIERMARYAAIT